MLSPLVHDVAGQDARSRVEVEMKESVTFHATAPGVAFGSTSTHQGLTTRSPLFRTGSVSLIALSLSPSGVIEREGRTGHEDPTAVPDPFDLPVGEPDPAPAIPFAVAKPKLERRNPRLLHLQLCPRLLGVLIESPLEVLRFQAEQPSDHWVFLPLRYQPTYVEILGFLPGA